MTNVQNRDLAFKLNDIVFAQNYGQGPCWVRGKAVKCLGPRNFVVTVVLHDQTFTWKRHVDQLKAYSQNSNSVLSHSTNLNASDVSPASHSIEERRGRRK